MARKDRQPASPAPGEAHYLVPTAHAETEFTEKRSRFITHVWRVEREEEARAYIAEMKARYHDARHNCWCYLLREGCVVRYSDDGEPQGTAGQPMLEVFRREGVENVCCVVTRYFGGILLGAGGLTRAYARAAAEGLSAAGISTVSLWLTVSLRCPYSLFERVKLEVQAAEGAVEQVEYDDSVRLRALLPQERAEEFTARIVELTAGGSLPEVTGRVFRAFP
ncbi:IMPACT family member YigZ [bioreactor metagenome]|uniref:IMPACT family member YigZ n=1 Tax=bioreactor metagenome TaxID=1076179 RepID=A0A645F0N0_9ZZZZ